MLIDSHVNLHAPQFAEDDGKAVIVGERVRPASGLMVTICDKVSSFEAVHALAMALMMISGAPSALIPHEAKENPEIDRRRRSKPWPTGPKVAGIGDAGWTSTTTCRRARCRPGFSGAHRGRPRHRPATGRPHATPTRSRRRS